MRYPLLLLLLATMLTTGCASLPIEQAQSAYQAGQYDTALKHLTSKDIRSKDRLLALMEKGKIQYSAGRYADSTATLLEAAAMIESQDFVSISEQATSLAVNDWATTYRGEYSERLWVHTYLMMNFVLQNKLESAAVEARRALEVFDKFPAALNTDVFTRALTALIFEKSALHNDAYVEYRKLAELLPDATPIAIPLRKQAIRAGQPEVANQYAALLDTEKNKNDLLNSSSGGELIIFVANGQIPQKIAGDLFVNLETRISFPVYQQSFSSAPRLQIIHQQHKLRHSAVSTPLSDVANSALTARGKSIALKQLARIGTKHAIVNAVDGESETTALILRAALFLLEEADTRGWESLPAYLTLFRVRLPAGTHDIRLIDTVTLDEPENRTTASTRATFSGLTIREGQTLYRTIELP